jgi:predicted nucleic acid-binding protein
MLVVDTSVLLAALDADEATHDRCRELLTMSDEQLVIPSPVLPELGYWADRRLGVDVMITVLDDIRRGAFTLEEPTLVDLARIQSLLDRYRDLKVGFVDTAILTIVERLDEPKLATLDHRHFRAMRPRHVDVLDLVPS